MKARRKPAKKIAPGKFKRRGRARSAVAVRVDDSAVDPVRHLAQTYGLSNETLSRVTGAAPRTISYWNSGLKPQRSSAQKLKEVSRLFDALADIIKAHAIGRWLQSPNRQFDGSTPLQVIERGESDRLWRMIWQLREGNSG